MSLLVERLNKNYQRELSKILLEEAKEEFLNQVNITEVRITNDLSFATIYYVCPKGVKEKAQANLEHSASYLRTLLARRVQSRKSPQLIFKYDEALEYGNHINEILAEINK